MTGSHYTLHKRSVSRSYNTPILDRYHFVTFMPRNSRKNSANHRLITLIPPSEMPSILGITKARPHTDPGLVTVALSHRERTGERPVPSGSSDTR